MHVKTRSSAKVVELLQFCTPLQSYVTYVTRERHAHALYRQGLDASEQLLQQLHLLHHDDDLDMLGGLLA